MRKIWFRVGLVILLIGTAFGLAMAWRGQPELSSYAETVHMASITNNSITTYYAPLSPKEIDGLLYMVEEEKLARDVYLMLYNETGLDVFERIATSEQRHMDAVLNLMEKYNEKYNLTAPDTLNQVGIFQNKELQSLYDQLVQIGSQSEADALKVGALVEETDIEDLEKWINETDNEDIKWVYSNLMRGSENHLRAFVSQLKMMGVSYTPQVLPQEQVNEILSSEHNHRGSMDGYMKGKEGSRKAMYSDHGKTKRDRYRHRSFGKDC